MATSVGIKVGVEGEAEFKQSLKNMTAESKKLDAELKLVSEKFKGSADAQGEAAEKAKILKKQLENQQDIVAALKDKLAETAEKYGANSYEATQMATKLAQAQTKEEAMKNALADAEGVLDGTAEKMGDVADAAEDGAKQSSSFGDVLKANLVSEAIIGGVKALADAVVQIAKSMADAFQTTVKWADDLVTLSTNTGVAASTLQELEYMAGLTDTSVSTITGSLTKLTKQMGSASDGTGSAAEAFEKLGVSVTDDGGALRDNYDVFKDVIDALGGVANETERDALAMEIFGKGAQELNSLIAVGSEGMQAFADEANAVGYVLSDEMLDSLIEVSDAEDRFNNSLDAIKRQGSAAFAPIVSGVADDLLPAMQSLVGEFGAVLNGSEEFSTFVGSIVSSFMEAIPQISSFASGLVGQIVKGITENAPALVKGASEIVMSLVTGLAQNSAEILTGVVTMVLEIVKALTSEENVSALIGAVIALIDGIITALPQIIQALVEAIPEIITGITMGIMENLPDLIATVLTAVVMIAGELVKALPQLLASIGKLLLNIGQAIINYDWKGAALDAIKKLVEGFLNTVETVKGFFTGDFLQGVKDGFSTISSKVKTWGKDFMDGFIQGVKDKIASFKSVFTGIVEWIKGIFHFSRPDFGPLRDYEKWMPDFMQGMANGVRNSAHYLQDAVADVAGSISFDMSSVGGIAGGNVVNVYTQELSNAQVDYLIHRVNNGLVGV